MPSHTETKVLPYSAKQIFDLVIDIESYPKFLPWCLAAKITNRINETNLIADLVVDFKGFSQRYTSDVRIEKISEGEFKVNVNAIDGPFKNLVNYWHIQTVSSDVNNPKTQIHFFIDFEFGSVILGKMIGLIFEKATAKMIDAFEKRAKELYQK